MDEFLGMGRGVRGYAPPEIFRFFTTSETLFRHSDRIFALL